MNRRQKKKQFKKIHGCNPPKGWEAVNATTITDGNLTLRKEDIERFEKVIAEGFDSLRRVLRDICEALGQGFLRAAESMRNIEPEKIIEVEQDNTVVLAKALAEKRRNRCEKSRQWNT